MDVPATGPPADSNWEVLALPTDWRTQSAKTAKSVDHFSETSTDFTEETESQPRMTAPKDRVNVSALAMGLRCAESAETGKNAVGTDSLCRDLLGKWHILPRSLTRNTLTRKYGRGISAAAPERRCPREQRSSRSPDFQSARVTFGRAPADRRTTRIQN